MLSNKNIPTTARSMLSALAQAKKESTRMFAGLTFSRNLGSNRNETPQQTVKSTLTVQA
jgi:hypothetical protein